jgi:hypothetical protein
MVSNPDRFMDTWSAGEWKSLLVIFLLATSLAVGACSSGPGVDKGKFRELSRDAEALKALRTGGTSYQQFAEALQRFSDTINALRGKTAAGEEKDLLEAYADLLSIYHDGLTLWRYKIEFAPFGFVPKGSIYVGQDVDPIVFKYRFTTQSHLYEPTRQYWKSIPDDSLQIIWSNADSQLKIIENMMRYPG